jgi:cytochrome c-type biogenesis protein CcmH
MLVWSAAILMTAAVLAVLLLPMVRRSGPNDAGSDPAMTALTHDLAVYRDQLAELSRDETLGRIGAKEAEGARNEIMRRMLEAQARHEASLPVVTRHQDQRRRWAVASAIVLPVAGLLAYATMGRPDLPASPAASRLARAVETGDFPAMVARVEQHLAKNPSDAAGWLVIAPAYRRLGRPDDAAEAYATAIRLGKGSPAVIADYAEALMLANGGLISAEARRAFGEVLKQDPTSAKARFYLNLADGQEGKREQALKGFRDMLASAPADAPWRAAVEEQIADLEQTPAQRDAMIRGMVESLDQRLKREGGDVEGWMRLARSRMVLGERDKAVAALDAATERFRGDAKALDAIAAARKKLGL